MRRNRRLPLAIAFQFPSQLVRARATHPANGGGVGGARRRPGKFGEAVNLVESDPQIEQSRVLLQRRSHPRQRRLAAGRAGARAAQWFGVRHGGHHSDFKASWRMISAGSNMVRTIRGSAATAQAFVGIKLQHIYRNND